MGKLKHKAPLPVIILIIAFLCPTELSLYIAGLRFPPHRVAAIILFPMAIAALLSQRGLKLRGFDIAFIAFNIWTVAMYMRHMGEQEGLVYGGSLALEGLGPYLVARVWIRTQDHMRGALNAMAIAIAVAALIALPETLFGQIFTHEFLRAITGYVHPIGIETRMGLTRAYGTFDHPIHYGTFCAALLALFWYAEQRTANKLKRAALLCSATVLGLSSAPLLCLGLQIAMLIWEKVTRRLKGRASLTWVVIAGLYVGASIFSTRGPIAVIATGMTLDPWTGFYRLQTWEFGLDNVLGNPLFGIGLAEWDRPAWMVSSTVDAFWLVILMRTGIPALLLIVLAIALLARGVVKRGLTQKDADVRRLARGWNMSLIALCLIATTVHLWNVPYAFFFFFLGMAGWLADPARLKVKAKAAKPAEPRHAPARRPYIPAIQPAPGLPGMQVPGGLPA